MIVNVVKYDPERWLETTIRGISTYLHNGLNPDPDYENYKVVQEFPGSLYDAEKLPLTYTTVHVTVDAIIERPVIGIIEDNFDPLTHTIDPQEARQHDINFDVGIWSSDRSGGTTARMRARQTLTNLFGGTMGIAKFREATDMGDGGVTIRTFQGGHNVTERLNDIDVYRMVGIELEVRVYSRSPKGLQPGVAIEEILQDPHLTIVG